MPWAGHGFGGPAGGFFGVVAGFAGALAVAGAAAVPTPASMTKVFNQGVTTTATQLPYMENGRLQQ